ncbi:hypothetical protein PENSPDRAFT_758184 [Peniophora sp. CONT]|nr:hypothetical protein PENSPDRAFT_758184 [Peniophora sp. CONT]
MNTGTARAHNSEVYYAQVTAIMEECVFPFIVETFLFALHAVLTVYFIYQRWVKRRKTASLPMFILTVALMMFLLSAAFWSLDIYLLWERVYQLLPLRQTDSSGEIDLAGIISPASIPAYVQQILLPLIVVIGDTVSLWRAYVLFARPRWLYVTLVGVVVVESMAYILLALSLAAHYFPRVSTSGVLNSLGRHQGFCVLGAYILTSVAQLSATLSISFKAWAHWNDIRKFMPHDSPTRHSLAMLAVLIESGIIYFALLAWFGMINWYGTNGSAARSTSGFYVAPLAAMYPTLVVVIVATRRSVLEHSISHSKPSFGLRFATNTGEHPCRVDDMPWHNAPISHRRHDRDDPVQEDGLEVGMDPSELKDKLTRHMDVVSS